MAELINANDSLNDGRKKLNESIEQSERAEGKSDQAILDSGEALDTSKSVRNELNQVVIDGDSSVEAAQARVGADGTNYQVLKERLDAEHSKTTAQLAQTMSQTEFDSWVATLLDGGPSIFMDTLAMLESTYPDGAAGVALVRETDPAKIYVWNGSQWQSFGDYQGLEPKYHTVTPIHTTFIHQSSNLFNKSNLVEGYALDTSTGQPVENGTFSYTPDYIAVKPNTPHILSVDFNQGNIVRAMFYDRNFNYVAQTAIGSSIDEATSTGLPDYAYVRFSLQRNLTNIDTVQFNEGTVRLPYEPYYLRLDKNIEVGGLIMSNRLKKPVSVSWAGTLDVGKTRNVFETNNEFTLDYIELSSSGDRVGIVITPLNNEGVKTTAIGQVKKDGSNFSSITFGNIVNESSSLFNVLSFEDGAYKVSLNRSLNFPHGCVIEFTGDISTEKENTAMRLYGVETV